MDNHKNLRDYKNSQDIENVQQIRGVIYKTETRNEYILEQISNIQVCVRNNHVVN